MVGANGGIMFGLSSELVIYAAYALVGAGTFLLARMFVASQDAMAAQESLEDLRSRNASNKLVKFTRPFFTQYVVPMVRGKAIWNKARAKYKQKLVSAGLKDELTPDEFIGFKFVLVIFFPIVGGLLKALDVLDLNLMIILGAATAGWFYPDFWTSNLTKARQHKIRKAMPFIVDLLALSTEAGLDFLGAISKVVEKAAPSPLVDEFGQVLKEIRVGSSRSDALRDMAARVNMSEIGSFVAILISADQMGASIGKILRQQSEQIRNQRFVNAEKAGAAASQKVLIPLVLFILPAVMLMIFGPFLLGMFYGGSGGGSFI